MGSRKSATCKGRISGTPLTEYDTQSDAMAGAAHTTVARGEEFSPYRCPTCEYWHIAPVSRRTPSRTCSYCCDSNGRTKEAYVSLKAAEVRAELIRRERGIQLRPYECEHGQGWHLTKSSQW